jgi:hypothetical protein
MTATIGRQAAVTSWTSPLLLSKLTAVSANFNDTTGSEAATGLGDTTASFVPLLRSATATIDALWKANSAPIAGSAAAVELTPSYYSAGDGSPVIGLTDYTLNMAWAPLELSSGSDATFDATFSPDVLVWGGSLNLRLDDTEALTKAQLAGDSAIAAEFVMDSAHSYTGNIWITGTAKGATVGATSTQSFTYQGTGALTSVGTHNFYAAGAVGIPTAGSLVLTYASGRTVTGSAFPTGVNLSVSRNAIIRVGITAQYTGAVVTA